MSTKYERNIYQFLSFYRFASYALAVMFITAGPSLSALGMPALRVYIILGAVGVYTAMKVLIPLRWREGDLVTYGILIGDFLICILLVIFTNGLNSGFLLYSLNPIITAALLFDQRVTLFLATIASLSLSLTHLAMSLPAGRIAWIMQGQNLTLLIVYTISCFVLGNLTYHTNLNIRRRIQSEAIIEERKRLKQEIHDGVAQALSYLNLKTKLVSSLVASQQTEQAVDGLNDIRVLVQDTYEDIRETIDQLGTEISDTPLIPALAEYTREFGEKNGIRIDFAAPEALPRLSPVAELQLLRIVQEAMTNARRHASASEIELKLENTEQAVEITVRDDGRGFTPLEDAGGPSSGYHGLNIMKERAEGLGGTLTIASAPGQGTEVRVSLPIGKVRL